MNITVTHRSQSEIKAIRADGRFDEFMFFTAYDVAAAGNGFNYSATLAGNEVIEASQLFYHEDAAKLDALVTRLADKFGIDIDDAEDIISERKQLRDVVDSADAEDDFDIQCLTARCAKVLGFRAVAVSDEFGVSYMIDMLKTDLNLIAA